MDISIKSIEHQSFETFFMIVWKRFKKHKLALCSLFILFILSSLSLFAPFIQSLLGVSHDLATLQYANLKPGYPHLLGTNELGQDLFTRLIYGGRISLSVGFLAAITSTIIGAFIGLLSGYFGGKIDTILMRFTDAMLCIPVLPLMIVFAALDLNLLLAVSTNYTSLFIIFLVFFSMYLLMRFLVDIQEKKRSVSCFFSIFIDAFFIAGLVALFYWIFFGLIPWRSFNSGNFSSVIKLILIIVFFGWMSVARLARASAMQLKNMDFVVAAHALGASHRRVLLSHIFPNALAPIIVAATLEVGGNILYEAALSFLGLGIQPPVSSWGNMLNNAVDYIKSNPSLAFWPGLFILVTVACFNFLGDGLRDALDPYQVMKHAKNDE